MANKWQDKKVDVEDLDLDLQNPRLPEYVRESKDVADVRNYLLEKEDVLGIIQSIASNGYHHSAVAIVCEEQQKLIVLDGNRRLVACQLLLDPSLAPDVRVRKKINLLRDGFNEGQLKGIKITIAPSRKEAEREIWDIHVNRLLRPWEKLQRLRMYRNLIEEGELDMQTAASEYNTTQAKFSNELAKLYFYEKIIELGDDNVEEKMIEVGFNAIERLIISKNGKKLLKYKISSDGKVIFKNEQDAVKKLKKLTPYIIGAKKIPAQATQKELVREVFSRIAPSIFSTKKREKAKTRKKKKRSKSISRKALIPKTCVFKIDNSRLNKIYYELKKIPVEKYENAVAVLFRTFLEGSLDSFIYANKIKVKKNKQHNPRLHEKLTAVRDRLSLDPNEKKVVNQAIANKNGIYSIDTFHAYVHNTNIHPSPKELQNAWDGLEPFFRKLWNST